MVTRNQMLFCGGAMMLGIAFSSILHAAQRPAARVPKVLEAQEFVLKDATGRQLAAMHGQDGVPHFTLYDAEEKPKLSLSVSEDGSAAIILGDPSSRNRVSLVMFANGSSGISLQGARGSLMAAVPPDKNPNLEILSPAKRVLFQAVR